MFEISVGLAIYVIQYLDFTHSKIGMTKRDDFLRSSTQKRLADYPRLSIVILSCFVSVDCKTNIHRLFFPNDTREKEGERERTDLPPCEVTFDY